jgi:hypothetical protein
MPALFGSSAAGTLSLAFRGVAGSSAVSVNFVAAWALERQEPYG